MNKGNKHGLKSILRRKGRGEEQQFETSVFWFLISGDQEAAQHTNECLQTSHAPPRSVCGKSLFQSEALTDESSESCAAVCTLLRLEQTEISICPSSACPASSGQWCT